MQSLPGKAAGVGRLGDLRPPKWQEAITARVGVLKGRAVPLLTDTGMPETQHMESNDTISSDTNIVFIINVCMN